MSVATAHMGDKRRSTIAGTALSSSVISRAIRDSFVKLDPRKLARNPVLLASAAVIVGWLMRPRADTPHTEEPIASAAPNGHIDDAALTRSPATVGPELVRPNPGSAIRLMGRSGCHG